MRKITIAILILSFGLWFGCSDDDEPVGPTEPTIVTVTAATGSTAPARLSVIDTVWNRITPTSVSITADRFSSAGKSRPTSLLAVAGSVAVQAVVVNDALYLRLIWDDDTWDRWPGRFGVTSFDILDADTLAIFTQDMLSSNEDQAMLLFQGAGQTTWDVWHWRLVTTGAGYLAEGFSLTGTDLVRDAGNTVVAASNPGVASQPAYMHPDGPASNSHLLYQGEEVAMDHNLGWQLNQLVPGWLIDSTLYLPQNATARGSRFDIAARSVYSPPGEYVVVLHRALNTGNGDDQDLSGPATLDVRIGITNNSDFAMIGGDSRQGFTSTFKLNIP